MAAVVNLFTSFGYFLDERHDVTVLREVGRVLTPRGWLVLDTLNPEQVYATLVPRSRHQYPGGQAGQPDMEITEVRAIDREKQRVVKTIEIRRGDRTNRHVESVRMYSVEELHGMLRSVYLSPVLLWGDYGGAEYNARSPRIIIAAQANADDTI